MPRQTLKRRPDGRYACKYQGRFFYGSTQTEAFAAREAYIRETAKGIKASAAELPFLAYAARWLEVYKAGASKALYNAYAHYIEDAAVHIGSLPMRSITATDVKRAFNAQEGRSASHITKYCATLRAVFAAAVDDGAIQRDPCANLKRPGGTAGTHRALESWERELIAATPHDFQPAAMLMLYAGLRRGEALAFNVDRDADFEKGVIYVREAVSFSEGNQAELGATKTQAGLRTVPMFDPLRAVLEGRHGLAVTDADGQHMSQSAVKRKWESYLYTLETEANGIPKRWYGRTKEHRALLAEGGKLPHWKTVNIRTHDLRHTFCTMLYDAGVDIKTAMKWMGHSDESMILKVYAHLSEEKEKAAALAMAAVVNASIK